MVEQDLVNISIDFYHLVCHRVGLTSSGVVASLWDVGASRRGKSVFAPQVDEPKHFSLRLKVLITHLCTCTSAK
jgi:hypothetical protein